MVLQVPADDVARIEPGAAMLVQTEDGFYAPDGSICHGAYGPVFVIKAEDMLGFRPKNSADWFAQVGVGNKAIFIAGCRIHYVGLYAKCPPTPHIYDTTA